MNTPICDFVKAYAESGSLRLHMPGHKGYGGGMEALDITEIKGADSLYEANGIIAQSERNASELFGFPTYYSTEGSSQCIRAMLYLAMLRAKELGKKPLVAAARNVHKTFLSAAALLDLEVEWLYAEGVQSYLSCPISVQHLEQQLLKMEELPCAVYLTSPDYLGTVADISGISQLCHKLGIMLLVDNAHGAYLKFLNDSRHPIDLGADICSSSAHKTLPVLTGAAYLQLSPAFHEAVGAHVRNALALFGSTSPSYIIMQSMDAANALLPDFKNKLISFNEKLQLLKKQLSEHGYTLYGSEDMKLSISTKPYGYSGIEIAEILRNKNIVCEFADADYIVFMLSPLIGDDGIELLKTALLNIKRRSALEMGFPQFRKAKQIMSIRDAALSLSENLPIEQCLGRVLSAATVGCPPAVPILVCGEEIDEHAISCFKYYGIDNCQVVKR